MHHSSILSMIWAEPLSGIPGGGDLVCCYMDKDRARSMADCMDWQDALARLALDCGEWDQWPELGRSTGHRDGWLLSRIAAKDALRVFLKRNYHEVVNMSDIRITHDSYGRPLAGGGWAEGASHIPSVSLSHKKSLGIALVSEGNHQCGIDVEFVTADSCTTASRVLNDAEEELLSMHAESDNARWPLRVWCAKEAAGKAIGRGLHGGPWNFEVCGLDPASGKISLRAVGGLLRELPHLRDIVLYSYTVCNNGVIVASSLYTEGGRNGKRDIR